MSQIDDIIGTWSKYGYSYEREYYTAYKLIDGKYEYMCEIYKDKSNTIPISHEMIKAPLIEDRINYLEKIRLMILNNEIKNIRLGSEPMWAQYYTYESIKDL
jgi:hypothetical protein